MNLKYLPLRLSCAVLGLAVLAAPLQAQRPRDKGPKPKVVVVHANKHAFRAGDRDVFHNYYRTHRIVVTPLRQEVAVLVVRGKPLPPGIVRTRLAPDVLLLVPVPAPGYSYAIVGNRIVMFDAGGLVADILDGIFP
jgi:hypothetical protein